MWMNVFLTNCVTSALHGKWLSVKTCENLPHRMTAHWYLQMWILAAQFEVRQLRLDAARKILGLSLGMCPKDRTYKAYIEVSMAV